MDPTISVSKGVFVFKNGATRATKSARKNNKRPKATGILGEEITTQPFYINYAATWKCLQTEIEQLQQQSNAHTLEQLVEYVAQESAGDVDAFGMEEILPAAALLTGINQPDHLEQFKVLAQRVREKIVARVCMLQARDCATLKAAVETLVYNLIESKNDDDTDETEDHEHKRLRRSQCTMKQLQRWYRNNYYQTKKEDLEGATSDDESEDEVFEDRPKRKRITPTSPALVLILPDFECFSVPVLQDLVLLLSAQCSRLPFVLVLGVATSVSAVHDTLSYHVSSKIKLRIFQTQPASESLNEILDKVILSPKYAFHLSGKTFKFLTHIFLYYDFSINGFIQGFKYCLLEHFFQGNAFALCTDYAASLKLIKDLNHDDVEMVRRQLSFRPYVESINDCRRIIDILTDDDYLKKKLPELLRDCHEYMLLLRTFLEFLQVLVEDLPKCPLGKHRRELYALCMSRELVEQPEFKECWQMLGLMSKQDFVAKISKAIKTTEVFIHDELQPLALGKNLVPVVTSKLAAVKELLTTVVMAGLETTEHICDTAQPAADEVMQVTSRLELKERLLKMSKQLPRQHTSEFSRAVAATLNYIHDKLLTKYMRPLRRAPPLHELFVFSDIDNVRRNIIGAPRASLHMALNDPHYYLQCKCCKLRESSHLLHTLPDLSIVYKLHLECGRMINLYDWLQAFRAVIETQEESDSDQVDPQIQ